MGTDFSAGSTLRICQFEIEQLYKNALLRARAMLTSPDKYGFSYGPKAFHDWADDVENGYFTEEGREYTTYVCLLATNGSSHGALFGQMYERFPERAFLRDIIERFRALGHDNVGFTPCNIWGDLEKLGGGFNYSIETMRYAEKRKQIADKIREAAGHMDEVARLLNENL